MSLKGEIISLSFRRPENELLTIEVLIVQGLSYLTRVLLCGMLLESVAQQTCLS